MLAAQQPGGYWAEHGGPSTTYNYVYVHGLGLYYRFPGDATLPLALEAATRFHQTFTYPNVDRRDGGWSGFSYHNCISSMGWVGFSATPQGRRRLARYMAERYEAARDLEELPGRGPSPAPCST